MLASDSPSGPSRSSTVSPSRTRRSASTAENASSNRSRISRAPKHVAAGLGAEVQVGDQDRGRHGSNPRNSSAPAGRSPETTDAHRGSASRLAAGNGERYVHGRTCPSDDQRHRDPGREPGDRRDDRQRSRPRRRRGSRDGRAGARGPAELGRERASTGRAEVLMAARAWMVANGERVVDDDRAARPAAGRRDPVRRARLRALGARVLGRRAPRHTSPTRRSSPPRRSCAAAGSSRSATRRSG